MVKKENIWMICSNPRTKERLDGLSLGGVKGYSQKINVLLDIISESKIKVEERIREGDRLYRLMKRGEEENESSVKQTETAAPVILPVTEEQVVREEVKEQVKKERSFLDTLFS